MARRPIDGEDHLDITDSDQFELEQATTSSSVFEVGETASEWTGGVDPLDIADGGKIEVEQTGATSHLEQHGIVDGYSDGTYPELDEPITRAQMAKMANLDDLPDTDPNETTFTDDSDDIISGPAAQAAALKADLANLRKVEDEAKSDIAQDDASGIDTNALDDTLGKTLDASTEQGGAPALQDQVVTGIGLNENLVADSTEAIEEEEVDAPDATEVG